MKILGIDFETTGLSPSEDRITEVGAILWDWDSAMPVQMISDFVDPERPITADIMKLTGITDELISQWARPEISVMSEIDYLLGKADYAMAHNGTAFDKPFYEATVMRLGGEPSAINWLDSKIDLRYPEHITTRNLRHLASEHGFLNPFTHRAVFDVLTMLKVASNYPIEDIISRSMEPTLFVRAIVSFDDKEKAKARGYYWHAPMRMWWRSFKESDYQNEKTECGFQTALLEKSPE